MTRLVGLLLLAGCAGSPLHTSSLSPAQLTGVDDYTLCKAATPRELYSPGPAVIGEVRRRKLSCGGIYQYTPAAAIAPLAVPIATPQPQVHCTTQYIAGRAETVCR